jgi:hypothetical protein
MKDKILFLTIGLLIGLVVMQWGVTSRTTVVPMARAFTSDLPRTGLVLTNGNYFMDEQGDVWVLSDNNHDAQWGFAGTWPAPSPIPVSEIKFWGDGCKQIVAHDNTGYLWDEYYSRWNSVHWPGSQPVPTAPSTWGGVKSQLGGDND